jgi:hypothetical protein
MSLRAAFRSVAVVLAYTAVLIWLGYLTPQEYASALSGESGRRAANPDHSARLPLASQLNPGPNHPETLAIAG